MTLSDRLHFSVKIVHRTILLLLCNGLLGQSLAQNFSEFVRVFSGMVTCLCSKFCLLQEVHGCNLSISFLQKIYIAPTVTSRHQLVTCSICRKASSNVLLVYLYVLVYLFSSF